jgi:hypothetical protein
MDDKKTPQGGFPQKETRGEREHTTTGDGHPPRTGEAEKQQGSGKAAER